LGALNFGETGEMPKFVQFHHFGGEHEPSQGDHIDWNTGEHLRKFLETPGSWLDRDGTRDNGKIWLWGEWEPESEVIHRFQRYGGGFPRYLWRPYWSPRRNYGQCVNTDPMIFGGFYYADCQQWRNRGLRDLLDGSVIVFGSRLENEWVLDTVFVVSNKKTNYRIIDYDSILKLQNNPDICFPDGYKDIVLERGCGVIVDVRDRMLYTGATYDEPYDGMFSFFPCIPTPQESLSGFSRPALRLPPDYFDPGLRQGAGGANVELPRNKVKELWLDVKKQVLSRGLYLGISAPFPEKREAQHND
jgi:hypothetical protein